MVLGIALEIPTQKNGVGDFSQRHFWRWAHIFGVGHTFFFGVGTPKMVLQHHFFFLNTTKILYIESGVPNAIFFPNTIFGVPTPE